MYEIDLDIRLKAFKSLEWVSVAWRGQIHTGADRRDRTHYQKNSRVVMKVVVVLICIRPLPYCCMTYSLDCELCDACWRCFAVTSVCCKLNDVICVIVWSRPLAVIAILRPANKARSTGIDNITDWKNWQIAQRSATRMRRVAHTCLLADTYESCKESNTRH